MTKKIIEEIIYKKIIKVKLEKYIIKKIKKIFKL